MERLSALLAIAAACLGVAPSVQAQDRAAILSAEFRSGWRMADGSHMAALHLSLAPGWKTYWRSPGAGGFPPSFEWRGSENLRAVQFHWPRPTVHVQYGLRTIGYAGDFVLPIRFWPQQDGGTIRLQAQVDLGVCLDVCIPTSLSFDAALSDPGAPDPLIDAALQDRPETAREAGVRTVSCRFEAIEDGIRVSAKVVVPRLGANETAVIEAPASVWASDTQAWRDAGALHAVSEFFDAAGGALVLDRSAIRVTLLADGRAVELSGCPSD
jgi:DsbC/DsbD-like thiol-disulfide interchange protein